MNVKIKAKVIVTFTHFVEVEVEVDKNRLNIEGHVVIDYDDFEENVFMEAESGDGGEAYEEYEIDEYEVIENE